MESGPAGVLEQGKGACSLVASGGSGDPLMVLKDATLFGERARPGFPAEDVDATGRGSTTEWRSMVTEARVAVADLVGVTPSAKEVLDWEFDGMPRGGVSSRGAPCRQEQLAEAVVLEAKSPYASSPANLNRVTGEGSKPVAHRPAAGDAQEGDKGEETFGEAASSETELGRDSGGNEGRKTQEDQTQENVATWALAETRAILYDKEEDIMGILQA
ncbi:hypothetical protein AHAS_Ahas07G0116100 [Arachis hypogaea]